MLERQEEEFHNAMDESEEDVFGNGFSLEQEGQEVEFHDAPDGREETETRETKDKIQPLTKLQTLERTAKRLGQKMMETLGWITGTALGSKAGPAPSPLQTNTWGMVRPPRAGIGTEPWNLVSQIFDMMRDVVLRNIRRTEAVPVATLRSQSFSADKGNQKQGIGGKRVMHAYCSMCMAWHSGIHGTAEKIDSPDWAHGGLPHRSRECALTVVQQNQWRINDLGMGCVLSNFDGTNAFGATRRELLISTSQKAASEKDRIFAADSLLHGSMTLRTSGGSTFSPMTAPTPGSMRSTRVRPCSGRWT